MHDIQKLSEFLALRTRVLQHKQQLQFKFTRLLVGAKTIQQVATQLEYQLPSELEEEISQLAVLHTDEAMLEQQAAAMEMLLDITIAKIKIDIELHILIYEAGWSAVVSPLDAERNVAEEYKQLLNEFNEAETERKLECIGKYIKRKHAEADAKDSLLYVRSQQVRLLQLMLAVSVGDDSFLSLTGQLGLSGVR